MEDYLVRWLMGDDEEGLPDRMPLITVQRILLFLSQLHGAFCRSSALEKSSYKAGAVKVRSCSWTTGLCWTDMPHPATNHNAYRITTFIRGGCVAVFKPVCQLMVRTKREQILHAWPASQCQCSIAGFEHGARACRSGEYTLDGVLS